MADNDSEEEEADDTEDDLRENFIKEMMRAEFDRNLALKALTAVQPDQIDEGKWAVKCDFQQCCILRSVDSDEPVQPPLKLRIPKWGSVGSLTIIEYSRV